MAFIDLVDEADTSVRALSGDRHPLSSCAMWRKISIYQYVTPGNVLSYLARVCSSP